MKFKAVLNIKVIYEDFSKNPDDIRRILTKNFEHLINRGLLTDELSASIIEWSLTLDFHPQNLIMPTEIYLKVIYESVQEEEKLIKGNLEFLADYMASRGYLNFEDSQISDYSSQVTINKIV